MRNRQGLDEVNGLRESQIEISPRTAASHESESSLKEAGPGMYRDERPGREFNKEWYRRGSVLKTLT